MYRTNKRLDGGNVERRIDGGESVCGHKKRLRKEDNGRLPRGFITPIGRDKMQR